ncbi:MAG: alpha/beta hydrolase [Gammaproteobacteria bacterium]
MSELQVCRPAGTVILLPGWGERKETLLGFALDLANHGYRVVLVDLRGQGDSSGQYITYGRIEHHDIAQLISALYARKFIAGKIALVGLSEGASIALDTAASDRRVSAVVAVSPFVSLTTAIREVGNDYAPLLSDLVSNGKITRALVIADKKTGVKLADAGPKRRVGDIRAPVLYVAGGSDNIAPVPQVQQLATLTPHARFVELPGYPHMGLYLDVASVAPLMLETLRKTLGASGDNECLHGPLDALQGARYRLTWVSKFRLGNASANPKPRKIRN